ncbi:MAG TPA: UDP-N-acetylmuramoyl-L-alanyl-D-glutamate--2,6-diaminopimelate ligase [Solirubrobacterales bacterium]
MRLDELSAAVPDAEIRGDGSVEIEDLAYDSGRVGPGTLFVCVPGQTRDGHDFAPQAVASGAAALVVERPLGLGVPEVQVDDARAAMAPLAARFHGDPTGELRVAGITGTNGKTTTAFLLRDVLEAAGIGTGLLGTVKQVVGGAESEVVRTTPEAIDLQATFRAMLDAGDRACVMEVSSHALALRRTAEIRFEVAVFTNLTQDHLDFHADMDDYFAAKRLLFAPAEGDPPRASIVNVDDPYGRRLAEELAGATTFSADGAGDADFRAAGVSFDAAGARFRCLAPGGEAEVSLPLPGHFNVANALAAIAAASALGVELAEAAAALAGAARVPGRLEPVDEGQAFPVLVDYAHTPDSLDNVLRAARRLTAERLICVFGCGGDRDRAKRPLMGGIGAELADVAIVTSDNPRSEDPGAIIEEILGGIEGGADAAGVVVEADRRAAIRTALELAGDGDVVVIAGKGHEQGQEFEGGRKIPFDDRDVAGAELRALAPAGGAATGAGAT